MFYSIAGSPLSSIYSILARWLFYLSVYTIYYIILYSRLSGALVPALPAPAPRPRASWAPRELPATTDGGEMFVGSGSSGGYSGGGGSYIGDAGGALVPMEAPAAAGGGKAAGGKAAGGKASSAAALLQLAKATLKDESECALTLALTLTRRLKRVRANPGPNRNAQTRASAR